MAVCHDQRDVALLPQVSHHLLSGSTESKCHYLKVKLVFLKPAALRCCLGAASSFCQTVGELPYYTPYNILP